MNRIQKLVKELKSTEKIEYAKELKEMALLKIKNQEILTSMPSTQLESDVIEMMYHISFLDSNIEHVKLGRVEVKTPKKSLHGGFYSPGYDIEHMFKYTD